MIYIFKFTNKNINKFQMYILKILKMNQTP